MKLKIILDPEFSHLKSLLNFSLPFHNTVDTLYIYNTCLRNTCFKGVYKIYIFNTVSAYVKLVGYTQRGSIISTRTCLTICHRD